MTPSYTGPTDGYGEAQVVPDGNLLHTAELSELVERVNALSQFSRAVQRARGEGGLAVMFASEGLVITGGVGNVGGVAGNLGGGGSSPIGSSGSSPIGSDGDASQEGDSNAPGDGPVDYDDLAQPYIPPEGSVLTYQVRTRGGTATLIGFSEITSPSTPPKKYLVCTFSGSRRGDVFGNDACSGTGMGFFDITYSGLAEYSATTGLLISSGNQAVSINGALVRNEALSGPIINGASCFGIETLTQTTATQIGSGACCFVPSEGLFQLHSETRISTLSAEDTEEDAIARVSGSFGDWTEFGVINAEIAWTYTRTTGFSFSAQEAEVRVTVEDFGAGLTVNVVAYLARRLLTGPGIEAWQTRKYPLTTNASGNGTMTFSVTAEPGYGVTLLGIAYET
jgi:hypothetical protein